MLGGLFGYVFGAVTFFWLNAIPGVEPLRFALLGLAFGAYYLVFGLLYALASRRLGAWMILAAPALWVTIEYARGSVPVLALPWNFLGHSQHEALAVIQLADFAGAYGVSFLLVIVNQLVSQLPVRTSAWRAQALVTTLLVVASLSYGWYRLAEEPPTSGRLRVAVVQANVAARSGMSSDERASHLAAYARLTAEAARSKPELIVWPSSSLPGPISYWAVRLYVNDVAHRGGVPLLVGGAGGDKFAPARDGVLPYSNSEFLISAAGKLEARYDKVHLTPFTEQLPLQGLVRLPRWLTSLETSFKPGDAYTLFRVSGGRFGAPICWENAFPDVFRRFVLDGANFMVSATNEHVFGISAGPYQALAMNTFRAVENRVAVARAATTGVSAFIDSHGRIVKRVADASGSDIFVSGTLVWDVPLHERKTLYTRYGDLFAQAACALALALLLAAALRRPAAGD